MLLILFMAVCNVWSVDRVVTQVKIISIIVRYPLSFHCVDICSHDGKAVAGETYVL